MLPLKRYKPIFTGHKIVKKYYVNKIISINSNIDFENKNLFPTEKYFYLEQLKVYLKDILFCENCSLGCPRKKSCNNCRMYINKSINDMCFGIASLILCKRVIEALKSVSKLSKTPIIFIGTNSYDNQPFMYKFRNGLIINFESTFEFI